MFDLSDIGPLFSVVLLPTFVSVIMSTPILIFNLGLHGKIGKLKSVGSLGMILVLIKFVVSTIFKIVHFNVFYVNRATVSFESAIILSQIANYVFDAIILIATSYYLYLLYEAIFDKSKNLTKK